MEMLPFIAVLLCTLLNSEAAAQSYKLTFTPGANVRLPATYLPELEELTMCFWAKIHRPVNAATTIMSYSVFQDQNEIRFFFDRNSFGFYRKSHSSVRAHINTIVTSRWYHVCNMWSSWEGRWEIYINGNLAANGTNLATGQKVIGKGDLVIGQELDEYYSSRDTFVGSITDINLYDETLTKEWIENLFRCCPAEGNILAWSKMKAVMYAGVALEPSHHCSQDCDSKN